MGEAKRRRDAMARGEPDPMPWNRGIKHEGRWRLSRRLGLRRDITETIDDVTTTRTIWEADAARAAMKNARSGMRLIFDSFFARFRRLSHRAQAR
jgi:hypothetical protein